jgi:DNA polymerase-3 subunit gamma/tau
LKARSMGEVISRHKSRQSLRKFMAYQVLARKWRPQKFDEIVGQEAITQTLHHAIQYERIAHAYLFTGVRGIGKTSLARVFAKALRCENRQNGNPCDECPNCQEIRDGRAVDVLEIDGASNNSVENIREIRENVRYHPSTGHYKIYIIDEVHMLSTSAFNALLKTLEEPPAHVIFVFATTEVQKIPATVLSRCQRYDFKRASLQQIIKKLEEISKAENLDVDDGLLSLIAREAEGSLRDALSYFDQVIAFKTEGSPEGAKISGKTQITLEHGVQALGVVDRQLVVKTVEALLQKDPRQAAQVVQEVFSFGHDLKHFSKEVLQALRDLTLIEISTRAGDSLESVCEKQGIFFDEAKQLSAIGSKTSLETIQQMYVGLQRGCDQALRGSYPKINLEMLFIRLASLPSVEAFSELINKKGDFESSFREEMASPSKSSAPTSTDLKTKPASEEPIPAQEASAAQPTGTTQPTSAAQPTGETAHTGKSKASQRSLSDVWKSFLEAVKKEKPSLGYALECSNLLKKPERSEGHLFIEVTFPDQEKWAREQCETPEHLREIQSLAEKYFKSPSVSLSFCSLSEKSEKEKDFETIQSMKKKMNEEALEKAKDRFREDPLIKKAQEIFNAQISDLHVKDPTQGDDLAH